MRDIVNSLPIFAGNIAAVDSHSGETISYSQLHKSASSFAATLRGGKEVVFMEAENTIQWLIGYVGVVMSGKAVYLVEELEDDKTSSLVAKFRPSLLISRNLDVKRLHSATIDIAPDLSILLSTSGSTGSQKFVKLSYKNMASNAAAIAEYLHLDQDDIAFQYLRPHYSYGLSIINSHIFCGACLCFFNGKVGGEDSMRMLEEQRCTSFSGVPYTYEFLHQSRAKLAEISSLRYATQAGGKLSPDLVKEFAAAFDKENKRFFVMYGQTEASPRISFLPPQLATKYPSSIGVAIPGGSLWIEDNDGHKVLSDNKKGELVYRGPNVMMGYATDSDELVGSSETPPKELRTGDIAYREGELFYIVGRSSRFVKILGNRIGLDELQSEIGTKFGPCTVVGTDREIAVFFETGTIAQKSISAQNVKVFVVETFKLPKQMVTTRVIASFPLLPSGKVDLLTLREISQHPEHRPFLDRVFTLINEALGLNRAAFLSVEEAVEDATGRKGGLGAVKIRDLSLDSVAFVNLAVSLEELLEDELPSDWIEQTVDELEAIYARSA